MRSLSVKEIVVLALTFFVAVMIATVTIVLVVNSESKDHSIELPDSYDLSYSEDYESYLLHEELMETDWETFEATPDLIVHMNTSFQGASFSVQSTRPSAQSRTLTDVELISLPENDAWDLITDGLFTSYPTGKFNSFTSQLTALKQRHTKTVTCNVWYWQNPNDPQDFSKVTRQKTFAVNSAIADLFTHAMIDIYNDPSQPVFNLADTGMGTWVLRSKSASNGISAHALGVAIDINPSTGSFLINGSWYGNGYNQKVMTAEMWAQLPESHTKYHVLYDGCPIVEIFKAYGFNWGGDWYSVKDPMHISFIGDGSDARAIGYSNYLNRIK